MNCCCCIACEPPTSDTFIRTPGTESALADDVFRAEVEERIAALHRIGEPGEVAGAVVFLCSPAASPITGETLGLMKARGKWIDTGVFRVMPTYHPAYLLRFPPEKKVVWQDLQEVMRWLGRPVAVGNQGGEAVDPPAEIPTGFTPAPC